MVSFFKKHLLGSIISAVVLLGASAYFYFSRSEEALRYETARRGNILEEVSVTGKVKAAENVALAFEKSGRVSYIPVKVGDKVATWQTLVSLENGDLRANLLEAEANVKSAEAKLAELKRGSRPEEIQISQAKLDNTAAALADAKIALADDIKDAYTKSEDAVRNKVDAFFSNSRGPNPQISFSLPDSQLEVDLESQRLTIENLLNNWNASLGGLTSESNLSGHVETANKNLNTIKAFLDKAALAVNSLSANSSLSQTTIDGYKSNVSTARTNVNTAISNLSGANSDMTTATSNFSVAEKELALAKAGATPEEIIASEADLEGLEAARESARAQLTKTIISAPFNGIVTKQDAKVGEIVAANTALVSLISDAKFQIEAFVPEVDIAKIKIGDESDVTLDAYGDDVLFKARAVAIDLAETMLEGVSTYKVTLEFSGLDERIRSGMTANVEIATARRDNVVFVPQRAVISRNGKKIIKVLGAENGIEEREVSTGLKGSDGNIEITSGLLEGEKILLTETAK